MAKLLAASQTKDNQPFDYSMLFLNKDEQLKRQQTLTTSSIQPSKVLISQDIFNYLNNVLPINPPQSITANRNEKTVEEIASMFDHTGTFVPNSIQVVSPNQQPMSLDDVMKNLYREVVDPNAAYSYRDGVGNFLVASTAVAGELVKYGVQNFMHSVSHIRWVPETLGAMASTVDLLVVDPVKWLIKSEFEANCSKEQLSEFSRRYNELPSSSRVLAEMLGDGAILGGTVKIFDIANSVVKIPSKPLLAIEGTTSGIGEISAISEVGKTGATLGNKISMVGGIFEEVEGLGNSIENVGSRSIWSSRPDATVVENAFSHWKRHGKNFSDTYNAKQYIEFVKNFIDHPPPNTLEYIRCNGEKIFYNPDSNIFIATTVDGVPKTMMKPRNKLKYWENKMKENK